MPSSNVTFGAKSRSRRLAEISAQVAGTSKGREPSEPEQKVAALVEWLDQRTIQSVFRDGLHESLTQIVDAIHGIGESIHHTFFAAEMKPAQFQSQTQ